MKNKHFGRAKVKVHTMNKLQIYNPKLISLQRIIFLLLTVSKILKVKVTMARSKVKSWSHHDGAHLRIKF